MDLEKQHEEIKSDDPFVICGNFIRDNSTAYIFSKDIKGEIDKALQIAFDTIKKLEESDGPVDVEYKHIEKVLNLLKSLTIERERTDRFIGFIRAFILIAHNVNENTIINEEIRNKIAYIQRYCDNALTYSETLGMFKIMTGRMKKTKGWTPPSFRLSRHYYDLLKEE